MTRPVRSVLPALAALLLLVSCEEPETPLEPLSGAGRAGAEVPAAEIVHPRMAVNDRGAVGVLGDGFTIHWQGVPGSPGVPIVGYQLKLIEVSRDLEPIERFIAYLTDGEDPWQWSPLRRANRIIPEHLVVDEPEGPDDPYPPLMSIEHYYASHWWPHIDRPLPSTHIEVEGIDPGHYLFAVRAVDARGDVTPVAGYAFATYDSPGNLLWLEVHPPDLVPALDVHIDQRTYRFQGPHAELGIPWPVSAPIQVSYEVDVWYGRGEGPSRYRIDCDPCDPGQGVGSFTDWGHWSSPIELELPPDAVETAVVLTIQAQDGRQDPEHQIEATITFLVSDFQPDRPALLVDDFKAAGLDDCTHDAFLEPLIRQTLAPDEELAIWNAHHPVGPCQEVSTPETPTWGILSPYRTIFWAVAASGAGSAAGIATDPDPTGEMGWLLAHYVHSGGNLVVWGRQTIGALLGDFYPPHPYTPDTPRFDDPNFGAGTFVYDMLRLRHEFDRVGRGVVPELAPACGGVVGLEITAAGRALGLPPGVPDPTGFLPDRTAIWISGWTGEENPGGTLATLPTGDQLWNLPGVEPLYTAITNVHAWPHDPAGVCGDGQTSPLDGQPAVVAIDPLGTGGKIVWFGTDLYPFRGQPDDMEALMRGIADWIRPQ